MDTNKIIVGTTMAKIIPSTRLLFRESIRTSLEIVLSLLKLCSGGIHTLILEPNKEKILFAQNSSYFRINAMVFVFEK